MFKQHYTTIISFNLFNYFLEKKDVRTISFIYKSVGGYGSKEVQKNELFAIISSHPGYGSSTEVIVGKTGVKMKSKFME